MNSVLLLLSLYVFNYNHTYLFFLLYYNELSCKTIKLFHNCINKCCNLIYSCRFAGKKCSAKDFKTILTDQGLCFTFKPDKNSKLRHYRELRSWHTGMFTLYRKYFNKPIHYVAHLFSKLEFRVRKYTHFVIFNDFFL